MIDPKMPNAIGAFISHRGADADLARRLAGSVYLLFHLVPSVANRFRARSRFL